VIVVGRLRVAQRFGADKGWRRNRRRNFGLHAKKLLDERIFIETLSICDFMNRMEPC
jgi:hypothetical protein